MAFKDPQVLDAPVAIPTWDENGDMLPLTVTDPITLPRTGLDLNAGNFRNSSQSHELVISHQYAKRVRHTARLNYKTLVPDVVSPTSNALYTMSAYLVVDVPTYGIPLLDQETVTWQLLSWLYRVETAGEMQAKVNRVIGGES